MRVGNAGSPYATGEVPRLCKANTTTHFGLTLPRSKPLSLQGKVRPKTARVSLEHTSSPRKSDLRESLSTAVIQEEEPTSPNTFSLEQYRREIEKLQGELGTAKAYIKELQRKPRPKSVSRIPANAPEDLSQSIWKGAMRDKDIDKHYLKRDLLAKLEGKPFSVIDETLQGYGVFTRRKDIRLFLKRCMRDDQFFAQALIDEVRKKQQYPILEDIQPRMNEFRRHFAVQNRSKSELLALFRQPSPNICEKRQFYRQLTRAPLLLPQNLAVLFSDYIWKNSQTVDISKLVLAEVPAWDLLRDVIHQTRLEFALKNIPPEDVPSLLPVPLTHAGLVGVFAKKGGLSEDQAHIFADYIFPNCGQVRSLAFALLPSWKTASEIDTSQLFEELAEYMTSKQLFSVALRVRPVSAAYIALGQFMAECEKEFRRPLTPDQRTAIRLFGYANSKQINALNFTLFIKQVVAIHLQKDVETPINAAKEQEEW